MTGPLLTVVMVGAGGVGSAAAKIAARRDFLERYVVSDYDLARAERVVDELADPRFVAARVDASSAEAVATPARENGATHVFNAGDKLYRNHVSLIKDLVHEIGRGVRMTYSVKFV